MTSCHKCGGQRVKRCRTCGHVLCVLCWFYKRDSMTNKPKSDCIPCYNRKRRKKYLQVVDPTLDRLIGEGYIDDTPPFM